MYKRTNFSLEWDEIRQILEFTKAFYNLRWTSADDYNIKGVDAFAHSNLRHENNSLRMRDLLRIFEDYGDESEISKARLAKEEHKQMVKEIKEVQAEILQLLKHNKERPCTLKYSNGYIVHLEQAICLKETE